MKLWVFIAWLLYIISWRTMIYDNSPWGYIAFAYVAVMSSILLVIITNDGWDYIKEHDVLSPFFWEIPSWFLIMLIGIIAVFFLSWG